MSSFNCRGCKVTNERINEDLATNMIKYNKLNGCIEKNFDKSVRVEIKQILYNIVSKPALKYGSETWILRALRSKTLRSFTNVFYVNIDWKYKER